MSVWESYPKDYRVKEVKQIQDAVCAGQCVSVVGLSGSGKSNLVGFITQRIHAPHNCPQFSLVDCNRLIEPSPQALYRLMRSSLEGGPLVFGGQDDLGSPMDELAALDAALEMRLSGESGVCMLLDRFEVLTEHNFIETIAGNLRALRDAHKYHLTYVIATRRPLVQHTELAELFFGRTIWLGPLSRSDALWSARRDSIRFSGGHISGWAQKTLEKLVDLSWGYPSLLRACCEAHAEGTKLEIEAMRRHPAIERRVSEFWADEPSEEAIQRSGLMGQPLLASRPISQSKLIAIHFDTTQLTAKENLLLAYLLAHVDKVCEKDELVQAVWPEDVIYEQGVRDDSLAQLVRRLRVKIEPDPSEPVYIHTVPGRGYLFRQSTG